LHLWVYHSYHIFSEKAKYILLIDAASPAIKPGSISVFSLLKVISLPFRSITFPPDSLIIQVPAQMSHSFFGLSVAKTSPIPAAVNPNFYATDPTGFNSLNIL